MSPVPGDLRPRPAPNTTNGFYWDAAAEHRLVLQRCRKCSKYQYPPDVACVFCQSQDAEHVEVSGTGTLYSFAVVDRLFHVGWASELPYVVGLVELTEQPGLRLLTNIVESSSGDLSIGMDVEVVFEDRGVITLPQFRPKRMPPTGARS